LYFIYRPARRERAGRYHLRRKSVGFCSPLVRYIEGVEIGLPGGWLGVGWGFRGINLTEPSPNPQATPSKMPPYSEWMALECRSCSRGMNSKKQKQNQQRFWYRLRIGHLAPQTPHQAEIGVKGGTYCPGVQTETPGYSICMFKLPVIYSSWIVESYKNKTSKTGLSYDWKAVKIMPEIMDIKKTRISIKIKRRICNLNIIKTCRFRK